jgi:hypothetical protein
MRDMNMFLIFSDMLVDVSKNAIGITRISFVIFVRKPPDRFQSNLVL